MRFKARTAIYVERGKIKGLFEATTILHVEVHASVLAEKKPTMHSG